MNKKTHRPLSMAECARVIAVVYNYKYKNVLLSSRNLKIVYLGIQKKYYNANGDIADSRFKTEFQYWDNVYKKDKCQPPKWAIDLMWNRFKITL